MAEEPEIYDAFLSYNSQEIYAVRALRSKLQACGIQCWLDAYNLLPAATGPSVAFDLSERIRHSRVFIAFVGPALVGPWQASEIASALQGRAETQQRSSIALQASAKALQKRATEVDLRSRIILVCLPGLAKEIRTVLQKAMKLDGTIVFESHLDEEGPFKKLLHDIKGYLPTRDFPEETSWIKKNPYKGLEFFQEEDHDKFFGRDELTGALIDRIQSALDTPNAARLFVLLGASGCGKSSLARAGVVAGLKYDNAIEGSKDWVYATLVPNDNPLASLAASLAHIIASKLKQSVTEAVQLAKEIETALREEGEKTLHNYFRQVEKNLQAGEGHKFVVLVDQFEETFTLCHDEKIRRAFIDNLRFAASQCNGPGIVILTLRSDFQSFLAQYGISGLDYLDCLQNIYPVEETELREAIKRPAHQQHALFEARLMEQLLADARIKDRQLPQDAEAGTLPLLQDVLFKLWPYRWGETGAADENEIIPLDAYDAIGAVHGALAKRADAIYQNFSPEQQAIVRDIFLGLLHISPEGGPVTRKRVDRKVFDEEILNRLVRERLLVTVTAEGKVEIIHEILLRHWPALQDWLKENRDNLYRRQQIEEAAQRWEDAGRDDADVYSGNRLTNALEWHKQNAEAASPLTLNVLAEAFLRAGEKKARAAKRRKIAGIAFVVSLVVIFTAWLGREWAHSEELLKLSEARRTAAEAQAARDVQFDLSLLLAAAGGQDYPEVAESLGALLSTTLSHPNLTAFLQGHTDGLNYLAFSHDDHTLASASSDDTIILWDVRDPQTPRKIKVLEDHTDNVNHLAFSHDDHTLASASSDDTIILWDVRDPQTPRKIKVLEGYAGEVNHLAFSHDDHTLASANGDGTVILWDVRNPQVPRKIQVLQGHMWSVNYLAFSHDDRTLAAVGLGDDVILWNVRDPQAPRRIKALSGHTDEVNHLAFSHDDHIMASASTGYNNNNTVILWDVHDPQSPRKIQILQGHTISVWHLAFSRDNHTLASASADKTVILWDVRSPQAPRKIQALQGHTDWVNHLAFSPDGHTLASASKDKTVILWDVHDPQMPWEIQTLQGHVGEVDHLAFSHDGHTLASASKDNNVILWDVRDLRTSRKTKALQGHMGWVRHLAFSPDGHTMASVGFDSTIILWDVRDPQAPRKIRALEDHTDVLHLAFSPDGHTLASASEDKTVILWDVRDPQAPQKIQVLPDHTGIYRLAFSHDGHTLASASRDDDTIILWDVRDPKAPQKIQVLPDHTGIYHLAFSHDGHTMASASEDKTVILWDVRDSQAPRKIQTLQGHTAVRHLAFSHDDRTLASANWDSTVILWDVRDPQVPRRILALQGHMHAIDRLAFSPDDHTLASASKDKTIVLWDVRDPQASRKIQVLQGHTEDVDHLSFSPNGHTLTSVSRDGTLLLWDINPASLARKACRIAGRNMTYDEWRQYMGDKPYRKICEEFPLPGEAQ